LIVKFASLPPSLFKREREPFRIALFDRRHYLAIHPDEGGGRTGDGRRPVKMRAEVENAEHTQTVAQTEPAPSVVHGDQPRGAAASPQKR
jgi:hypothetical protein